MTLGPTGSPRRPLRKAIRRRNTVLSFDRMEERMLLATFTVTSTAAGLGAGTFAQALADAQTAGDDIVFNINGAGPHEILTDATTPLTVAPGVLVNGYTDGATANTLATGNDASLVIQINGTGTAASGINIIVGAGAIVRGLSIVNFASAGVSLNGTGRLEGSWIGVDTTGAAAPNGTGVVVAGAGNSIGSSAVADRNVISGNTGAGINLSATAATPTIVNNYIGTTPDGATARPNANGIIVAGSAGVTIGATGAGNANLISGNSNAQVALNSASNSVINNSIGLNAAGTSGVTGVSGLNNGVTISGVASNVIGGPAGSGNAIGGNLGFGVLLTGAGTTSTTVDGNTFTSTGTNAVAVLAGAATNSIGATTGNTIAAGSNAGVFISGNGANTNTVARNSITGSTGVLISAGAQSNVIGGSAAGLSNTITGAVVSGVVIDGTNTNLNQVLRNSISGSIGVSISGGAQNNSVGLAGTTSINTISGANTGVLITGSPTNNNRVVANSITGSTIGVVISGGAQSNQVGQPVADAANTISTSSTAGVQITGTDTNSNTIVGNSISASTIGIQVAGGASLNQLGSVAAPNTITGYTTAGIQLTGNNTSQNTVLAQTLAGGAVGVLIDSGASANSIGSTTASEGNTLSGNSIAGVQISGANSNVLLQNSFTANTVGVLIDTAAQGNTVGGLTATSANTISASVETDLRITGASTNNNVAQGNSLSGTGANAVAILAGATGNTIGGTLSGVVNTIAGGTAATVLISGTSTNSNVVAGNAITASVIGVLINAAASQNTIGGTVSAAVNTVSAGSTASLQIVGTNTSQNVVHGNSISGAPLGVLISGIATANTIGGTISGAANTISGSSISLQITDAGTNNNVVLGNSIAAPGTNAVAIIGGAQGNTIGGSIAGVANTIAASASNFALRISGGGTNLNVVAGNSFATGASIAINTTAQSNTIGGTVPAAANTLSGVGTGAAITIADASTTLNVVQGNSITLNSLAVSLGIDADGNVIGGGNTITGNTVGVFVGSRDNTIGGSVPNIISGNSVAGIQLFGDDTTIDGNWIGLDTTGAGALASQAVGIFVNNVAGTTIGALTSPVGNTISGNTTAGIRLTGANAESTSVNANVIGLNAAGTAAVANPTGILIESTVGAVTIGGTTPNTISGNTVSSIDIQSDGVNILRNVIGLNSAGDAAVPNPIGLSIDGRADISVIGNTISGNTAQGLLIQGQSVETTVVNGNVIGLGLNGLAVPNSVGIDVLSNVATGLIIGGTDRNTISGNTNEGVIIRADGTVIDGNVIGLNSADQARPNSVGLSILAAADVTVGGASGSNVISGNTNQGIFLTGAVGGLNIQGNFVGTNAAGTAAVGNSIGIDVSTDVTQAVTIGGTTPNVVSGNTSVGIRFESAGHTLAGNFVGTNAAGTAAVTNAPIAATGVLVDSVADVTIDGTTNRNVISGNRGIGLHLQETTNTSVRGNFIGTSALGDASVGNGIGISVDTTPSQIIGGNTAGQGNLISGNTDVGIDMTGIGGLIIGNTIGLNLQGTLALGNATGIRVDNVADTTIGGTTPGDANIISGNTGQGILIQGAGATDTSVFGNRIGTSPNGLAAFGNAIGVQITGPSGITIGGATAGQGNLISGNTTAGVRLDAAGNAVFGNTIGPNVNGNAALTGIGLTGDGVLVNAASSTIGGSLAGQGNLIAGNPGAGVHLIGLNSATNLTVLANTIGLNGLGNSIGLWVDGPTGGTVDGSLSPANTITGNTVGIQVNSNNNRIISFSLNNNATGILVFGAAGTTIGSTTAAERNTITGSTTAGISLQGASGSTSIIGNWIGLDSTGLTAIGNNNGILVNTTNAFTLDGTTPANRNLIAGNNTGVRLLSSGHAILGNIFGQNTVGAAVPNSFGVVIENGDNNTIGGTVAGQGNTITGTLAGATNGVLITGTATANRVQFNEIADHPVGIVISAGANLNTIGAINAGNEITGSSIAGVNITGPTTANNLVIANTITLNDVGVLINDSAAFNSVGGVGGGQANLLSLNTIGVEMTGSASNNEITGNVIGTDSLGLSAAPNSIGVLISSGTGNSVDSNLISGNTSFGVQITGATSTGNTIDENVIGLNSSGNPLGNGNDGVAITSSASGNTISSNIIASNIGHGIAIDLAANSNSVVGNVIGLDLTETLARPNNGGILINGANANIVGGAGLGNTISGNNGNGIELVAATNSTVAANLIGLNFLGQLVGNSDNGVFISTGSQLNLIGTGNTISGNDSDGIEILGASSNSVSGNFIGTGLNGLGDLGNAGSGVLISNASSNSIGLAGAGNLISGNDASGITIDTGSQLNVVVANTIGLDANGAALPNRGDGVTVLSSSNNSIGTSTTGEGNLIAANTISGVSVGNSDSISIAGNTIGTSGLGNTVAGISISTDSTAVTASGNTIGFNPSGVLIDASTLNTLSGNSISSNTVGVMIQNSAAQNVVDSGNTISSNLNTGVEISTSATLNTIGGGTPNVISGNLVANVLITSNQNTLTNNWIGLNTAGTAAQANNSIGVWISGAASTSITGNTISGQTTNAGILIDGSNASSTTISGNVIGLNATGTAAVGNSIGVEVDATVASGLIIGGATPNTIAGNTVGVQVDSASQTIAGNWFGLAASGASAVANLTNIVLNASDTTIGGTTANALNILSGSASEGLLLTGSAITGTRVIGNWVGLASDGVSAVANATGIRIDASAPDGLIIGGSNPGESNTIAGNTGAGVLVENPQTTVIGNVVGLNTLGAALPNANGIVINNTASVTIGGLTASEGNTIAGNTGAGVLLQQSGTTGTLTVGNVIGLNATGTAVPNGTGVLIEASTGASNTIGGSVPNTISGNTTFGVDVRAASNLIAGNWIGLNLAGSASIANNEGVIVQAANVSVGGTALANRNVISGNTGAGVRFTGSVAGSVLINSFIGINPVQTPTDSTTAIPNSIGVIVDALATGSVTIGGSSTTQNIIAGNSISQVELGSSRNVVAGNWVGLARDGVSTPIGASLTADGVVVLGTGVTSAQFNTIGQASAGLGNTIGGVNTGVFLTGTNAANTTVLNNLIGLNATGNAPLAVSTGILISGVAGSTIGGSTALQRNTISGATGPGVQIAGSSTTLIQNNLIGLLSNGTGVAPNSVGVLITGTSNANTINGNLISGNTNAGVELNGAGATQNAITANTIGLDINGASLGALSNATGVLLDGVTVANLGQGNTIGGSTVATRNFVSGNRQNGIFLTNNTAFTTVAFNVIGLDPTGNLARPNGGDGVQINQGNNNLIGIAGGGNVISANTGWGIEILGALSAFNVVQANTIGFNTSLGGNLPNILGPLNITNGNNSVVADNVINAGGLNGIVFDGSAASNNLVSGTTITNALNAVVISNSSSGNTIGSGNAFLNNTGFGVLIDNASGNIVLGSTISGNTEGGVLLENDADNNTIGGANLITSNGGHGIWIDSGSNGNIIGGTTPNTISGNTLNGIELDAGGNSVGGNIIGLNSVGAALANQFGIFINNVGSNTIGVGLGNTISGNAVDGIGVDGVGATGNTIQGNLIGLNTLGGAAGTAIPNGDDGISLTNAASANLISGNTVSGNVDAGVEVASGATGNTITANLIGLGIDGLTGRGNGGSGIEITDAPTNLVSSNTIAGNVIGVLLQNSASTGNSISGNTIGLNTSLNAVPNTGDGVRILNAPSNSIGAGNRISSNGGDGVEVNGAQATGNRIFTNTISGNAGNGVLVTNGATGTTIDALNIITTNTLNGIELDSNSNTVSGNSVTGNTRDGLLILGAASNLINGGNTISSNLRNGVELSGLATTQNTVTANVINTNSLDGVLVTDGASNNTISSNTISGNLNDGVEISLIATRTTLSSNTIGTNLNNGVFINNTASNTLSGSNSISGNSFSGIEINGAAAVQNLVGINTIASNSLDGVLIGATATNNSIGAATISGTTATVTGNGNNGVQILGSGNFVIGALVTNNTLDGVLISGANNVVDRSNIDSNARNGLELSGAGATGNTISGSAIASNTLDGIRIDAASGNVVGLTGQGNTIELNGSDGVEIVSAQSNLLTENLISGNAANGVFLNSASSNTIGLGNALINHSSGAGLRISGDDANNNLMIGSTSGVNGSGPAGQGNSIGALIIAAPGESISGNTLGGTISGQGNTFAFNSSRGIVLSGAGVTGTLIQSNTVRQNGETGIYVTGATATTIGGSTLASMNVIQSNTGHGILLTQAAASTLIQGNRVGTSADGLSDAGNGFVGVGIHISINSTVTGNLVAGNGTDGLVIGGSEAVGNLITANTIGLSASGAALGNDSAGVRIIGAINNTIGAGNVVSGNAGFGVVIERDATDNLLINNWIGLDPTGLTAVSNNAGGVLVDGTIGNTNVATTRNRVQSNTISGNQGAGIEILGVRATSNTISSNIIGLNTAGGVVGNGSNVFTGNGVHVGLTASDNQFDDNVIRGSAGNGVQIDTGALNNRFSRNTITGNAVDGVQLLSNADPVSGHVFNDNIVSGNSANGVHLIGARATANSFTNNSIGLAVGGLSKQGNGVAGVVLEGAVNNTFTSNFLSGNTYVGAYLLAGASGNTLSGNFIGLNAQGLSSNVGNGDWGVYLQDSSSNRLINNFVAANQNGGLLILGSGSQGNLAQANFIGTDVTSTPIPSGSNGDGVILASSAANNTIDGNVIGGHKLTGVRISNGATANLLTNNAIGVNRIASAAIANSLSGVVVDGNATANTIGAGNTISGNREHGVFLLANNNVVTGSRIGLDGTGNNAIPNEQQGIVVQNASGTLIGPSNVISGNRINGVLLNGTGASNTRIIGNTIGLNASGTSPIEVAPRGSLPVTDQNLEQNGIRILYASSVTVGGTTESDRNVISGNGYTGIIVEGNGDSSLARNNLIQGNWVGLNAEGTGSGARSSLLAYNDPNYAGNGITLLDAPANSITGNTISGNPNVGVWLLGGATQSNVVQSNVIGLDKTGLVAIGNHDGVVIRNAPFNIIGAQSVNPDERSALGNTISGNPSPDPLNLTTAISLLTISNVAGQPGADPNVPGTPGFADNNLIVGNFLGTNVLGGVIGSNDAPRGSDVGIYLNSVQNTTIHHNVISGNAILGVQLFNNATVFNAGNPNEIRGTRPTTANVLTANSIGTNFEGNAAVPNGQGVFINDASGNTIGGDSRQLGNIISGNLNVGLQIMGNNIGNPPEGSPRGTPRNPINRIASNTVGLAKNRIGQIPNQFGIFVNGANNPVEGNNAIGNNRFGGLIVRPARVGPTVDRITTIPSAESGALDTTPIERINVSFGQYVDPTTAVIVTNYRILKLRNPGAVNGIRYGIKSVTFDVVTRTATLTLETPAGQQPLTFGDLFRITVIGAPTRGIRSRGKPTYFLDGTSNSRPGTNFVTQVQRGVELNSAQQVTPTRTAAARANAGARVAQSTPNAPAPKLNPAAVDKVLHQHRITQPRKPLS